jgi:dethiobiotin synthetase
MSASPYSPSRPRRLIVVVGTATEIGKTWVASRLLRELRAEGFSVAARKPVQSFSPDDSATDAHHLSNATGEEITDVCPRHRWFPIPMAPPMAADALGRAPFTIAELAAEISWPLPAPDIAMVECAGGVRSPHAVDGDAISLIEQLQPDLVLLVADAGLGTINSVRLSLEAIDRGSHVATPIVVLNRFDPAEDLHRRNRDWLEAHLDVDVLSSVPAVLNRLRPSENTHFNDLSAR